MNPKNFWCKIERNMFDFSPIILFVTGEFNGFGNSSVMVGHLLTLILRKKESVKQHSGILFSSQRTTAYGYCIPCDYLENTAYWYTQISTDRPAIYAMNQNGAKYYYACMGN